MKWNVKQIVWPCSIIERIINKIQKKLPQNWIDDRCGIKVAIIARYSQPLVLLQNIECNLPNANEHELYDSCVQKVSICVQNLNYCRQVQ